MQLSELIQVHFLCGRFFKKEFIIKRPLFSIKSASNCPLGLRCPISNCPTISSSMHRLSSFASKSPMTKLSDFWRSEWLSKYLFVSHSLRAESECAEIGAYTWITFNDYRLNILSCYYGRHTINFHNIINE